MLKRLIPVNKPSVPPVSSTYIVLVFHCSTIWQNGVNLMLTHLVSPACQWMTLSWSWQSAPPSEWLVRTWNRTTLRISMPYYCNPTSINNLVVGFACIPTWGRPGHSWPWSGSRRRLECWICSPANASVPSGPTWRPRPILNHILSHFDSAISSTRHNEFLPGSIFLAQASSASMFSEVAKYSNSTWPQFWGHFPSSRSEMVVLLRIWKNPYRLLLG